MEKSSSRAAALCSRGCAPEAASRLRSGGPAAVSITAAPGSRLRHRAKAAPKSLRSRGDCQGGHNRVSPLALLFFCHFFSQARKEMVPPQGDKPGYTTRYKQSGGGEPPRREKSSHSQEIKLLKNLTNLRIIRKYGRFCDRDSMRAQRPHKERIGAIDEASENFRHLCRRFRF